MTTTMTNFTDNKPLLKVHLFLSGFWVFCLYHKNPNIIQYTEFLPDYFHYKFLHTHHKFRKVSLEVSINAIIFLAFRRKIRISSLFIIIFFFSFFYVVTEAKPREAAIVDKLTLVYFERVIPPRVLPF